MTEQNRPVRNHTVNKSHLARFALGTVLHRLSFDGVGAPVPVSLNDAAVRKSFYIPEDADGNRDYAFEGWASNFEGAATSGVRSIVDDGIWPPLPETRLAIAEWIALQEMRTPVKRAYASQIAGVLISQLQSDGALERLEDKVGWHFSDAERQLLRDEVEAYRAAEGAVSIGMHLDLIKAGMASVVPMLMRRGWILIRFDHESLCTSDNPIGMAGEGFSPSWLALGLSDAPYVSIAIDRKVALVLPIEPGDGQLDGQAKYASAVNLATMWNADEVLFIHPDDDPETLFPPIPPRRSRAFPPQESFKDFSEWPIETLVGFVRSARDRAEGYARLTGRAGDSGSAHIEP